MSDETTKTPETTTEPAPTLADIPRTLEQIQEEYKQIAQALGNLVFQLEIQTQQKNQMMNRMNELGLEASKLPPPPPAAPAPKKLAVVPPPKTGGDGT